MFASLNVLLWLSVLVSLTCAEENWGGGGRWLGPRGSCSQTIVTFTCPPTSTGTTTLTCLRTTTISPSSSDTTTTVFTSTTVSCTNSTTVSTVLSTSVTTSPLTLTITSNRTTFTITTSTCKVRRWCGKKHTWCDEPCRCCQHAPSPPTPHQQTCCPLPASGPCVPGGCPAPPACPPCPPPSTVTVAPSQYCMQVVVNGPTPVSIDTERLIASVSSAVFK